MPIAIRAAALSVATLLCAAVEGAERPLFDPSADSAQAIHAEAGRVEPLPGDAGRLHLATDSGQGRFVLTPPVGEWNLSAVEGLTLTLRNPGVLPVTVRLLAETPQTKGLSNACRNAVELRPGEARSFLFRLTRTPEDPTYAVFNDFYMYYTALNVRDNTLDPAHVSKLTISISGGDGKEPASVDLGAITPTGAAPAAPVPFFPFVDAYGQYTHGDWPGKIYTDADFARLRDDEQNEQATQSGPKDWDQYGGWAKGPTLKATGFFHAAKHDGKWWLVDPDGKLFWSYGVTGVGFGGDVTPVSDRENWFVALPANDSPLAQFYRTGHGAMYRHFHDRDWRGYDIQRANLFRKYGPDYPQASALASHARLRSWGFNTMGNWSDPAVYGLHKTPYTVAINYGSATVHRDKDMPDVFDPGWEPAVRKRMEKEVDKTAGDPWNLGYFIDNERWFGWRPRAAAVGECTLQCPPKQAAKVKFVGLLTDKYKTIDALNAAWSTKYASWDGLLNARPSDKDASAMMKNANTLADCGDFGMLAADRYFSVCRDAVKAVAPNNMYLGSRFFGHTDPELLALAGKYCDVVSYNIYDNPPDGRVNQYAKIDVPILSSEWGIESDPMQTPFRDEKLTALSPAERAAVMTRYAEHALMLPNLVGAHFFQYRDQPLTGRPDGEATLRGFVNVADTPNFELVQANRQFAAHLYERRAGR